MSIPTRPLTQLKGSNGPVHALAYSSSPSTYILTGSADRSVRLYNPSRPASQPPAGPPSTPQPPHATQLIQTYAAHGYEVLDISVSGDNARFASVGGDRSVFLWDVATARTLRRLGGGGGGGNGPGGHTARINAVTFAGADDALLVSGSFDASVRVWDTRAQGQRPAQVLADARDSVSCVVVRRPGGHEIFAGSVDGRVRTYDLRMGKVDTDVLGRPVTSLAVTRDGQGLLVGTLDSVVRLMDRGNGTCLKAYHGGLNTEYRVRSAFGGSERLVVSGSERGGEKEGDGEVLIWDTVSGSVVEKVVVPGAEEGVRGKVRVSSSGEQKERKNVISAVAWKDGGRGDQWCCAGTDGLVTVFGT